MVIDIGDVDWAAHLPLILHVVTLGEWYDSVCELQVMCHH